VTRSKELRRIERAIVDRNESELRWALAECELRKKFRVSSKGAESLRLHIDESAANIQIEPTRCRVDHGAKARGTFGVLGGS
jgi:hypothetical protein